MKQEESIHLERCPHCSVAKPNLVSMTRFQTQNASGRIRRIWACYFCKTCGGVLLTAAFPDGKSQYTEIIDMWPTPTAVDAAVPGRAKQYLEQAISSVHAPSGAVMLAASSVDAMLKEKGLKQGNLYGRINEAAKQHLITEEMATWAHEVRLDANDERHADEEAELPSTGDAERVIEFTLALAQFLFVLPSRVERGRRK
ncbi:DUF4145 domain-containing protein [Pseudomonas putida]|uniref:DUF4145 domain-containing protein n=1 Tax=Pseudomonas putida TaxID=303 RepID=UPI0018AB901C|nr:DUF4145 domain-containing protein [Pseudomonas putida]MBF8766706.1 DUF4145 domain-containing protein [Pseudomonas putida]